jgi:GTP-binding protein
MSLEEALEFLRADEVVEVTPDSVRLRQAALESTERRKLARRSKAETG